ncbi:MAG: transcriptional repressor [Flavobacteriaceae bacterium]|nr:transcriptional repressor [Flavobacteriaceae bacterium]
MGILRKTKSLDLLLKEFDATTKAISVVELVDRLMLSVNKSTIYRALDKLEKEGILHSFLDQNGIKWYAKCHGCSASKHTDVHPHFQCKNCGEVECLPINYSLPGLNNYKVESTSILLTGLCAQCT